MEIPMDKIFAWSAKSTGESITITGHDSHNKEVQIADVIAINPSNRIAGGAVAIDKNGVSYCLVC